MVNNLGANETITSEGAEDHEEGDMDGGDYDPNSWIPTVVGEVLAIVEGKGKQKGTSKGFVFEIVAAGKGNGIMKPQFDKNIGKGLKGKGQNHCFECVEEGHLVRDCNIRKIRIAAGGPAILPGNPNSKGSGKGTGNNHTSWYPTQI